MINFLLYDEVLIPLTVETAFPESAYMRVEEVKCMRCGIAISNKYNLVRYVHWVVLENKLSSKFVCFNNMDKNVNHFTALKLPCLTD